MTPNKCRHEWKCKNCKKKRRRIPGSVQLLMLVLWTVMFVLVIKTAYNLGGARGILVGFAAADKLADEDLFCRKVMNATRVNGYCPIGSKSDDEIYENYLDCRWGKTLIYTRAPIKERTLDTNLWIMNKISNCKIARR